ncbi:type II toxin-antitoxin system prevent-host-death family antitoxin [Streptomyces fumanus]|uniref:type II toxin-antitoxin system prevent-host-death family antitoxin n=1 Tax=Streptomyces fumanus TaxID=67302 RepID=UPI0033F22684
MAADQGIQIAYDGVAEVSMTAARAKLTQLIRDVRYGGRHAAFTERGQRSAYVVPVEFYEQAVRDRERLEYLCERAVDPGPEAKTDERVRADTIRSALHSADLASG